MSRILFVLSIILLQLLSGVAFAAPAHHPRARHNTSRWHGYGWLPGYQQPPSNSVPVFGPRGAVGNGPDYAARYWYLGAWHYFGRPGFTHGRYNGGGFGPCWTWTPIGRMWNCG